MLDNPNDQARLFYLVILGSVVAVWVFARYRNRLGQAAQHAAIWVLIFIGAVLAFGFKDNLRMMLYSDEPQQISESTVVLKRERDGHFHTTVEINGQKVHFIVDTGASHLVLSKADAEAAGIDIAGLDFVIPTQTANGRVMSATVRLTSVVLGQFTDQNVRATVNGGDLDQSLLGMSYLDRYDGFTVEGDRMFLWRK